MRLAWLEQREADVASGDNWLGASEIERFDRLQFAKRRADWRLGRWTAKRALALFLNLPDDAASLVRLEILAAADGAPEAFLDGAPAPAVISLSHRGGVAACAVAPPGSVMGCDLEIVEPRSGAFAADYFTAAEQSLVARAAPMERFFLLALLWSAKESVTKALRTGLRIDTREIEVQPATASVLRARHKDATFDIHWHRTGNLIRTLCWQGDPPDFPRHSEHWPLVCQGWDRGAS